jgi:hypothetical protein
MNMILLVLIQVSAVALCPENSQLVSGTREGSVVLWCLESFNVIQELPAHTRQVNKLSSLFKQFLASLTFKLQSTVKRIPTINSFIQSIKVLISSILLNLNHKVDPLSSKYF